MRVNFFPSKRKNKKLVAIFRTDSGKIRRKVHFGASGYSDYTLNNDEIRKFLYIQRHKPNENWNDPYSAGALSRFILWNKPTLDESIEDYKRRFGFK